MTPPRRLILATVAILGFLEIWSSFMWPLMVTRDSEYRPAILGLFFAVGDQNWYDEWGKIMAFDGNESESSVCMSVLGQELDDQ